MRFLIYTLSFFPFRVKRELVCFSRPLSVSHSPPTPPSILFLPHTLCSSLVPSFVSQAAIEWCNGGFGGKPERRFSWSVHFGLPRKPAPLSSLGIEGAWIRRWGKRNHQPHKIVLKAPRIHGVRGSTRKVYLPRTPAKREHQVSFYFI